jgi:hypothetical protein
MDKKSKNWLQIYVDAMTEKDPYRSLALIRELKSIPRKDRADETLETALQEEQPAKRHRKRARAIPTARRR